MASSKGIHVKNEQVGQMGDLFDSLPEKEQETIPLQQAVDEKLDSILSALKKGYTVEELAHMLGEKLGITVSATTLSRCIAEAKRKRLIAAGEDPQPKTRKSQAKGKSAGKTSTRTAAKKQQSSVTSDGDEAPAKAEESSDQALSMDGVSEEPESFVMDGTADAPEVKDSGFEQPRTIEKFRRGDGDNNF